MVLCIRVRILPGDELKRVNVLAGESVPQRQGVVAPELLVELQIRHVRVDALEAVGVVRAVGDVGTIRRFVPTDQSPPACEGLPQPVPEVAQPFSDAVPISLPPLSCQHHLVRPSKLPKAVPKIVRVGQPHHQE